MRCYIPGKDTLPLFTIGPISLPILVVEPDKRVALRTQKSALRW